MAHFQDMSIRRKLTLGMTAIAGAALLLSAMAVLGYESYTYRDAMVRQLVTLGDVVGQNSRAALAFSDAEAAGQILESLKSIPSVDAACLYDPGGRVFATYPRGNASAFPALQPGDQTAFQEGHLVIFHPIRQEGGLAGTVYLRADLKDLKQTLRWNLLFNLGLFCVLGLMVAAIAYRVQRYITAPLLDLAALARLVSDEKDYSVRSVSRGADEIGSLVEAFNNMLSQIQRRDDQLQEYHEHLEEQVSRRTGELVVSNEQLQEAKLRAEAMSRAKSAFLANMSHELRTPLNAILLYSELLGEDAEVQGRESDRMDLQRIHGSGQHLLRLINDILDLSKVEAGKMSLSMETVDLSILVQECLQTVQPLADKNGNTLSWDCAPGIPAFLGDTTKLRQALFNLLSNACKFTAKGSVDLHASTFQREGGTWIRITVRDTGIGMTEAQQERIFQEFTQAEESTSRRYGGTGLGLALSRKLCQLMGGDITVASELGKGSTFTLEIPAPPVAEGGNPAEEAPDD
ncbi:MAG: HAMP domain-containing protein [Holophagaceae bacterium]|nr:HAMP domain-containing protein [Holophagaceae bacterium]